MSVIINLRVYEIKVSINLIILGHFRVIELIPFDWSDSNMTYLFLNVQQQLELEMQEKERQRLEELQRAQELLEKVIWSFINACFIWNLDSSSYFF